MGLRQEAVKGVVWSVAQGLGIRLISFLVTLVLARLLMPEAFGLVAYASVFIAFAQIFIDQGFSDAIVQSPQIDCEHLDTAFWTNMGTGALIALVGVIMSGVIAKLFKEPQLAPIVSWLSLSFVFSGLSSVQQALLQRQLAFKSLIVRSLIAMTTGGAVALGMALLGFGIWSLVAKILVSNLVSAIALWQVSDWRPALRFSKRHFKDLFSFGINIVGGNFVDFFSLHADDFLIGYFLGPIALGYYTLAYNVLIVTTQLLISLPNAVIFPAFSRLQNAVEKMRQPFHEFTQFQSILTFPVFLGLSALAPELVTLLYGPSWVPSIPVFRILMLIGIVRSSSYFYSSVIKAAGKPSWRFGIWSLTALLNVIGFLLVVRIGIVAVASVYVFISYLVFPIYLLMIRNLIGVNILSNLKQYLPAMSGSILMVIVVFMCKHILDERMGLSVNIFLSVSMGAITYLLALRIVRPSLYKQVLELIHLALPKSLSREV